MRRLPLHPAALAALALLACLGCPRRGSEAPAPERILLVTIDTLRADHVGCYGAERAHTTTLDALAAAGVRFEGAVSPAPLTLPAHSSLMTALDPPAHGVRHNGIFRLPDEIPTLAERLREAGYATGAVVGALVLDRRHGLARGFDVYDDRVGDRQSGVVGWAERRADRVVDAALALQGRLGPRFFLWVHFYDPHLPYDPPPGFASAFASRPYAGEIAFADAQLGRLLTGLKQRWGESGLLVVATSDHGESLGEHGEATHSYTLYEATQHVPLLIAGPGLPAGQSVAEVVGLVDVAPTLLALARARPFEFAAGHDLRARLGRARDMSASAYFETLATQLDFGWSPLLGLRSGSLKYIRAPRPELYDLAADPAELRNLAVERPEQVASLDAALEARLAGQTAHAAPSLELSPVERAGLESLGYLAPAAPPVLRELGRVGGPDPKDHLALLDVLRRAEVALARGESSQALALLRALGEAGPEVAALRAAAAVNTGDPIAGERDARAALAAAPARSDVRIVLAQALDAQGRESEALAALRALPIETPLEPALALRVAAADGPGDISLRRLARAFERHPEDAQVARAYADSLAAADGLEVAPARFAGGEADASLAAAEGALPAAAASLRPHLEYLRAEALFRLGRRDASRRALVEALDSPHAGDARWRGRALSLLEQVDPQPPAGERPPAGSPGSAQGLTGDGNGLSSN